MHVLMNQSSRSPGNGHSFISVDLSVSSSMEDGESSKTNKVTEVEVAVFETGSFDKLGYKPIGEACIYRDISIEGYLLHV
jgi:hypothetical protein